MRAETKQLLKKYKLSSFGAKKDIVRVEQLVLPGEELLYIGGTVITISNVRAEEKYEVSGAMFISDRRILFHASNSAIANHAARVKRGRSKSDEMPRGGVWEFGMADIHSIGGEGNGLSAGSVSFSTLEGRFDFTVSYHALVIEQVRTLIVDAAINAQGRIPKEVAEDDNEQSTNQKRAVTVVTCSSCAASNIVRVGEVSVCEYCRSYVGGTTI